MTEQRILAAFETFDLAVDPDPAFADRLFGALVSELDFGTVANGRRTGGAGLRVRRALGIERLPVGRQAIRLAYLAAMLGLLLLAATAALFVAGRLQDRPGPEDLVRMSKAVYQHPPAFSVTYRTPEGGTQSLAADGTGTWRIANVNDADPKGQYWLWDGTRLGLYDPNQLTWQTGSPSDLGVWGPPLPLWSEVAWGIGEQGESVPNPPPMLPCANPQALPEGEILGHAADHIVCTDIDMEYWLDRETHIVLRMEPGPQTPHWDLSGPGLDVAMEAIAFEVGPRPAADFAWTGPPGAYPPDKAPASRTLAVGAVPPMWSGTTPEGEPFSTADVRGPAVYLFAALWCPPCGPESEAVTAAMKERPSLTGVLVSNDSAGQAAGYYGEHPTTMTLVADPDGVFAEAWGLTAYPTLVLVDGQGRVAAMIRGRIAGDGVATVLDALEAGQPIPSVPLVPEDEAWPEEPAPSFAVTASPRPRLLEPDPVPDQARISEMPFGALIPSWEGPRMGGGRFDSSMLQGRPSVVLFWTGCEGCETGAVEALDAALKQVGDNVGAVIVVGSEPTPGWTADLFKTRGWTVPVVFDWDNRIQAASSLSLIGAQVFDADGRLVDERVAPPTLEEMHKIAATLGAPAASASPGNEN